MKEPDVPFTSGRTWRRGLIIKRRANTIERRVRAGGARAPSRRAPRQSASHEHTPSASSMSASRSNGAKSPSPATFHLSQRHAASGRPLQVLVVEDDAIIAMEIEMMLQDLGAEVVGTAMTAAEAVRLAELHGPDCATMDISIKGERDGVSVAMELYETLGIRSIFVSAYGNDETRTRAAPAQPFGWVNKPVAMEDLRSALDLVPRED